MVPHASDLMRYGIALVTVAATFGARILLHPILDDIAPFMLFIVPIMLSAWYGGLGPGILATLSSAVLADYFFIEPLYTIEITGRKFARQLEWILFILIGASISLLNQARISSETRRVQHLEREQEARKAAEVASQVKDEFLATVSHELRTPLTAILGWSTLSLKGKLDQVKSEKAMGVIDRNARILQRLIEDLLDVSRIVSGKLQIVSEPARLTPVIEAAADMIRPVAEAKGVQLSLALDSTADRVMGDSTRLQQVVWNLLSNAVKFTPPDGRVDMTLDRVDSKARITVRDTGKGICSDFLPCVFDRFRQACGKSDGMGLGLAIAKSLVELHGGTIEVFSAGEGQGATFTVCIPLLGSDSQEIAAPENLRQIGRGHNG